MRVSIVRKLKNATVQMFSNVLVTGHALPMIFSRTETSRANVSNLGLVITVTVIPLPRSALLAWEKQPKAVGQFSHVLEEEIAFVKILPQILLVTVNVCPVGGDPLVRTSYAPRNVLDMECVWMGTVCVTTVGLVLLVINW